jgi:hypothetical protein
MLGLSKIFHNIRTIFSTYLLAIDTKNSTQNTEEGCIFNILVIKFTIKNLPNQIFRCESYKVNIPK